MSGSSENFVPQDGIGDRGEQIQRLLFRIIPFWPLVVIGILLGYFGAKTYLRYQVPVYTAKARLIVNDETEQKSANLQEILKIDTRNLSSETEKEIQILSSKDLLRKVAYKLQLNITYTQKGRIRTTQYYSEEMPFKLTLENPDSVKTTFSGIAEVGRDNTIIFNQKAYPADSLINGKFGRMRWTINKDFRGNESSKQYMVNLSPLSNTVGVLKGALSIAPISKLSSIVDLTYADAVPSRAVAILNTLVDIYGKSAVDYKSRIYENSQRFLDERLRFVADDLNGVEKSLETYKTRSGIVDLGAEGELYLTQVKETDRKIAEIEVQLDVLNQINLYVTRRNSTKDSIPATLGITDPVLTALLNQLYQAEADLGRVKELSGGKNPQIEVYEDLINRLKPGITGSINNLKINLIASRNRLQTENSRVGGILNKIPVKERLLLDISRQQAIKNAIYTFLLQKREESAIAAASIVPNYRLIEKPEKGGIISPEQQKIYLTAFFITALALGAFIYLKEFAGKKILFRSQMEDFLPIPVISELVYQEHDLANPIVVGEGKRTLIAEQFRELRTNINYITASSNDKCKIILTTSSIPKEGKSFVAMNAAISLSLTGDKVVLLEFDLRKPKISKPMGIASDPGLSNYLVGNCTEQDIIKPHATINNLYVIPSGPTPPNPAELMRNDRLVKLFSYLKQNFDFVLIDSPPIAAVTDAKILAPFADAVIYIVRHNYTNQVFINLLNDVYQKKTLKNINIVFNGIKNKKILGYTYSGYGYGYGYGYNYGYGYTVEDNRYSSFFRKLIDKIGFRNKKRKNS